VPSTLAAATNNAPITAALRRMIAGFGRHWLAWANTGLGVLVGLPWLAPVLMKLRAAGPAKAIYFVYGFLCHQFADRSFFLFGPRLTYSYTELLPYSSTADTWAGLRAFIGAPDLGYKVAWSDRMVWMSLGFVVGGLLYAMLRSRLRAPGWRGPLLLILPMALDGFTHLVSDFAGVGTGFRYSNAWLAALAGRALDDAFYAGNAFGSLNGWLRFITGLLFGLAIVWFAYPRLEAEAARPE
jgi:uncharacterized membrane protein